ICCVRPDGRERFSPKLNANLSLWSDCAGRQSSLDRVQSSIRSGLLQTKRRFPLTHLDLRPRELMPVDKDVRGLECRPVRIKSVAVFKVAFQLEIELLGKIASEIDSRAAETKPILQSGLAKTALERRYISVFEIHLDESAQHQFQFRPTLLHINRRFLFDDSLFNIGFSVVSHLRFELAVGHRGSLFGLQALDLSFQFRVLFL